MFPAIPKAQDGQVEAEIVGEKPGGSVARHAGLDEVP